MRALTEVKAAFGADDDQFKGTCANGIVSWDVQVTSFYSYAFRIYNEHLKLYAREMFILYDHLYTAVRYVCLVV